MDATLEETSVPLPSGQRARHVHDITDRFSMTNTYLVDDGRLIVVDPGSVLNVRLTLHYIERFLHSSPSAIDLIVLTHLHPDHTAGVAMLRQFCNAPVAASVMARYLIQKWQGQSPQLSPRLDNLLTQALNQRGQPGHPHHINLFSSHYERQAQMVNLWLDDVTGLPNHPDWRVIASPGYTPESLCLYNPFSYELLCGDTISTVEGGSTVVRGGTNRRQLDETLRTLRNLQVYYVYPGHGRPILSQSALARTHVEW